MPTEDGPSSRRYVALLVAVALLVVAVASLRRRPKERPGTNGDEASTTSTGDQPVGEPVTTAESRDVAPGARAVPTGGAAPLDAAARERLRGAIWGALGEAEPAASTVDAAAAAYVLPLSVPDPPGDPGSMEPSYIQDRVRSDFFPLAKGCYDDALKAHADLAGQIVLRFIIVGDAKIGGIVESVDVLDKSTLRDPAMIECIRESFLDTRFPPPEHGGWVSVEYPITFLPDDDDGGD
jgi:hypothetical protein